MLFVLHTLYKSKEVNIFKAFTKCKHGNPVPMGIFETWKSEREAWFATN